MIEGVLNVIDQMLDLFWAGRGFGVQAIAGLGIAQSYMMLLMQGRMGLDMGMQAMISRAIGMGNRRLANHTALQAFTLTGAFSLLMVALGILLTQPLLHLVGVSEAVIDQASLYMKINFIGMGTTAFRMMSGTALQASGDTLTPMKATAVTRVIRFFLSPMLAFGWLGFPALGLPGLAVASVFCQLAGVGMNFFALFRGTSRLRLTLRGYRVDPPILWQQIKIGAPAIYPGMERSVAQLILMSIVAHFGDITLASYALVNRAQMFVMMGMMGLGRSSGVLVGQNLGAGKLQRARQTVLWSLGFIFCINAVLGTPIFIFPRLFLGIFSRDPELLAIATVWLRIQLVGYMFMGATQIFVQSFQTAGDTLIPMIVSPFATWGVQQPLAIMLSGIAANRKLFGLQLPTVGHLGHLGVAWAVVISMLAPLLVYVPYYKWGPWWKKRVFGARVATQPSRVDGQ
jgi:putative MATE family efflux protein